MVIPASTATGPSTPRSAATSTPKTLWITRTMPNTPALTTATACSTALTGAGATIATGNQPCTGTSAALTPRPAISAANPAAAAAGRSVASSATSGAPLDRNSTGPTRYVSSATAANNTIPPARV